MITLRRARERHRDRQRKREVWRTFHPASPRDRLGDGFGVLEALDEDRLPAGSAVVRRTGGDVEVITYVREGVLAYEESTGRSGMIHAGEMERTSAERGGSRTETNPSRAAWAHVFRIWLRRYAAALDPSQEQKRFSVAERRGVLRVVVSGDGVGASLRVPLDVRVCSALLHPGQHVVHELASGRRAWLHVVHGEVASGDLVMSTGDGAGIDAERAVSLTARKESEILLVDLPDP